MRTRGALVASCSLALAAACEPSTHARARTNEAPLPGPLAAPVVIASSSPSSSASPPASASASKTAGEAIDAGSALFAASPLISLPVPGFGDAIASVPIGTKRRRPIVVACHGNYDRPEWQCATWRAILDRADRTAFVLCPRGVARPDSPSKSDVRFTYSSAAAMAKELDAALYALRARFPDHVDDGPLVYTGFSLGAIYGVGYALVDPSKVPRLVLTEGSHAQWTPAAVQSYAAKGGRSVLFACGQPSCVSLADGVAKAMKQRGIAVRVVHGKGVGHGYDGAVADAIADAFDVVVEGDARFAR